MPAARRIGLRNEIDRIGMRIGACELWSDLSRWSLRTAKRGAFLKPSPSRVVSSFYSAAGFHELAAGQTRGLGFHTLIE